MLDAIRSGSPQKWDQLQVIFEHYGGLVRSGTSHLAIIYHPDDPERENLSVPVHNNEVKIVYVKRMIAILMRAMGDDEDD